MSKLDLQAEGIKAQKGAQPVIHLDPFDYIDILRVHISQYTHSNVDHKTKQRCGYVQLSSVQKKQVGTRRRALLL